MTHSHVLLCLPVLLSVLAFPWPASAHYAGQVLELQDGNNVAEIGIDTTDILPGRETLFSIAFLHTGDDSRWTFVPYDSFSVWATDAGGTSVFTHTFSAHSDPQTYLAIVFPRVGLYDLHLSFRRKGSVIMEGSVRLTVSHFFTVDALDWVLLFVLIAGAYTALLVRALRSSSAA